MRICLQILQTWDYISKIVKIEYNCTKKNGYKMIRMKNTLLYPFLMLLLFLGVLYSYLIKVDILKDDKLIIISKITQDVNFHIRTEYNLTKLTCNGVAVLLDNSKKHDYFYRGQEKITIPLVRGENICQAEHMSPIIKQKISFIDFIVLFILWGIPLFHLLFSAFIWLTHKISEITFKSSRPQEESSSFWTKWTILILLLGVVIRVAYFQKFGIMNFQHDWHGHIEFIKYVATNWTLPAIPMKGWEFPQQPLYYLITGGIYSYLVDFGFSDQEALHGIGYFSLFCSMIFLYYSYLLLKLLSKNRWVHLVGVIFVSLTPSLVYMSARINNDSLVMGLSTLSLYLIIKSYQSKFKHSFFMALASVSLLFLTKISTLTVELLFLTLLLMAYYKNQELSKKLYIYGVVSLFILGVTLFRVYMPLDETLYVVNAGSYPGQTLKSLDFSYFGTFNIIDLIQAGESHITGEDAIRHSFFTYQYGTMFFGEFDYAYFIHIDKYLNYIMPIILFLGLIYILGFIGYAINLRHEPLLHKILFAIVVINMIMILKFVITYPSICHTDFRFYVGSFTLWAFIFAKGLEYLSFNRIVRDIITSLLALLALSEVLFFWLLI